MSRNLVFIMGGFLLALQAYSQTAWVPISRQEKAKPTVSVINSSRINVSFTVQIHGTEVTERKVGDIVYKQLSIPDAHFTTEAGLPQVPKITKLIAIPDCDDVSLSVMPSNAVEFNNYRVIPAPRYVGKKYDDGGYCLEPVFEENNLTYSSNAYVPQIYGEILEVGYVREQKVARVALYPVQSNPSERKVRVFSGFTVNLSFVNPRSDVNKELGIFRNMMHRVAVNYDLSGISASTRTPPSLPGIQLTKTVSGSVSRVTNLDLLTGPNALPVDYLIITHSSLFNSNSLTTLANHRRDFNGYDVAIVSVNDMNGDELDPDCIYEYYPRSTQYLSVHDFVQTVYANGRANHTYDGHLGYIVLVGDAYLDDNSDAMVPETENAMVYWFEGMNLSEAADFYYARVAGDDDMQDIMYGRLSVGNESELGNVVNKILTYELNSIGIWNDEVSFVSGSYDRTAYWTDPAIKQMTELLPPPNSKKHYAFMGIVGYSTSVTEADPIFGQCFSMSDYENASNLCGAPELDGWIYDSLNAGINTGIHTFIYEGHGRQGGLRSNEGSGRVVFRADELQNRLNNNFYPFMIFNCCDAGWFDAQTSDLYSVDCVAEVVVNLANKGAIGCLASPRASLVYGFGYTDGLVLQAQYFSLSHVMGEAVMESKLNLWPPFDVQFNLYGDPAVNLWPYGFTAVENLTLSGTVHITKTITVAAGATLTIEPGTTLYFHNGTSLVVNGKIMAQGTSVNRIVLKTVDGTWNGIELNNADNSVISCCDLQNGSASQIGIKLLSADNVIISNCTISGFYYGIYSYDATSTTIQNVTISAGNSGIQLINGGPASISYVTASAPTVGIRSYHQSGLSISNSVSNYAQYGMIVDRVAGQLTSNTMNNCSLMGLYLVDADATITGNTFDSNARAIYCNYYSDPTIRSSTIRHCYPNSGIVNSLNSIPNLGTTGNRGNNYIYLNVPYNVQSYYPGSIYAQYNYWEEDCWDPRFYGTVVWEPSYCEQYVNSKEPFDAEKTQRAFKTSANYGTQNVSEFAKGSEWDGPIEGLESAYADYAEGLYTEALAAFERLIMEVPNTATAKRALAFAVKCLGKMDRETEKASYLQKIANDLKGTGVEILARHFLSSEYIKKREYARAKDLLAQVAEAKGSEEAKLALYDLIVLSVHAFKDYESATQYLTALKQDYPNDIETELADIELLQVRPGDAKPKAQAEARPEMDLQSYPNPFNPSTIIRFVLPIAGDVSVVVYDILGREVKVLLSGYKTAGEHEVVFDASNLPSGLYFCRLQAGSKMLVKKMVLVR